MRPFYVYSIEFLKEDAHAHPLLIWFTLLPYIQYMFKIYLYLYKNGFNGKNKNIKIGGYGDEADSFCIFNRFGSIGF